jgi:CobQ-like glutamine amidotransferase family enzyme
VTRLGRDDTFARRVDAGAVVLAVDAGLEALGHGWRPTSGPAVAGLGMLAVSSVPGPVRDQAVVTAPRPDLALPSLTGWVQTDVALSPEPGYQPFAALERGDGDVGACDGATSGRILGTRLHGPLAAVNPEVADLLLAWATDQDPHDLPPLDDSLAHEARRRRVSADLDAAEQPPAGLAARLRDATGRRRRRART